MINFGYHFARVHGDVLRRFYRARLPVRPFSQFSDKLVPAEVFSYSGAAALPEQIASIRTFLRYAGVPKSWTVVSDGSYDRNHIDPS